MVVCSTPLASVSSIPSGVVEPSELSSSDSLLPDLSILISLGFFFEPDTLFFLGISRVYCPNDNLCFSLLSLTERMTGLFVAKED